MALVGVLRLISPSSDAGPTNRRCANWPSGSAEAAARGTAACRAQSQPASCEDNRAAASIDLDHDEASYAGCDRVTCPLLVMWGAAGFVGRHYDVAAVWQSYATDVSTTAIARSGHFLAEEAPAATALLVMKV